MLEKEFRKQASCPLLCAQERTLLPIVILLYLSLFYFPNFDLSINVVDNRNCDFDTDTVVKWVCIKSIITII